MQYVIRFLSALQQLGQRLSGQAFPQGRTPQTQLIAGMLLLAAAVGLAHPEQAPPTKPPSHESEATQALIGEMRVLRQSLDQLARRQVQTQLATERWRIQLDLVSRLMDEHRAAQDLLESEKAALHQAEQAVRQYERSLAAEADPAQRSSYERELQSAQASVEQSRQRLQRLQEREGQTNSTLQSEQAKAQELAQTLESLDRNINSSTRNRN